MSSSLDRLYGLLPAFHRLRDSDQGEVLRELLQVIAGQVNEIEDDVWQLYENWFIETCQDWVVPYIGDLIGYRPVHEAGEPGEIATPQGRARNKILVPRREVANTIRYRRRKGTLALLEELAQDTAGWPARAVEFYTLLAWTQALNHLCRERGRTADLRDGEGLDQLDGPFDSLAHTVDVRRISSARMPAGRYNIPSVGLFVWRLRSYAVSKTPACCLEAAGPHCYTFSALGNNTPLYIRPEREPSPTHIAEELNLPAPIRRRAFEERDAPDAPGRTCASAAYYGTKKSVTIWAYDWPVKGASQPISRTLVIPADLSDWQYRPRKGYVAVDPVLGRIAFPPGQLPRKGVEVSYQYGFSADIGGGEYERPLQEPGGAKVYRVGAKHKLATINAALAEWYRTKPKDAVIEICENGIYVEQFGIPDDKEPGKIQPILLTAGQSLQLRAANRTRPILRLLDYQTAGPDSLAVLLGPGSHLTLDGLLITGRAVHIEAPTQGQAEAVGGEEGGGDEQEAEGPDRSEQLQEAAQADEPAGEHRSALDAEGQEEEPAGPNRPAHVVIRHCTLVPGWSLENNCEPRRPAEPSLELWNVNANVTIEHSTLGSIQVLQDEVKSDPLSMRISDSIVDATGSDCEGPECEALGSPGSALAHAVLTIVRCTVFGKVMCHAIDLAENTIFGVVQVARSQRGCMRFCYVRPPSRTPRRYNCQPDLARQTVAAKLRKEAEEEYGTPLSSEVETELQAEIKLAQQQEQERVRPQFNSTRYGTPTYCQLSGGCAEEILRGADDESEMGAFHDLYQPQRAANLRARLEEYAPAATDIGIIYAS